MFDRCDNLRADPDALSGLMNLRARLLLLNGLDPVFDDAGAVRWGTLADADSGAELVFLGKHEGRACFAAVPAPGEVPPVSAIIPLLERLRAEDFSLYAMARSLVDWHSRHRFCARCGEATRPARGGWQRDCEACGAMHFPRTDPVTIMAVERRAADGTRYLLMGRQPAWPEGRYSTLAGFVEPGETIEEAVAREVLEEAGIAVRDITYMRSQAWPFPSQLMIGCHAFADEAELIIDRTELDDAQWFSEQEVIEAVNGGGRFIPPPAFAVASRLIDDWLKRS